MRITSSDFSRRLCAFSVLRARICQATSRLGTTSAVMARAPSLRIASRRWRPFGVQKPRSGAVTAITGSRNIPVRKDVGELPVVGLREIALEGRRLDAPDRKDREE